MADQLTLRLAAPAPRIPSGLRPMLPRSTRVPFDAADHLFEPIWGGERVLAIVERDGSAGTRTRLLDTEGHERWGAEPGALAELADLGGRVDARDAVLDGELVAVGHDGRLDATGLAARLAGRTGPPLAFLAFDLLHLDGRPLLGLPLERRRERLAAILEPGPAALLVPASAGDGIALHAAVTAQGLGGVLARQRRSPYLPGVRSASWRFVTAGHGPAADAEAAEPAAPGAPARVRDAAAPVLTLIQRLPLDG